MAALTAAQILDVWHRYIDQQPTTVAPYTRTDLETAVTTTNTWVDNNQAAFVTALTSGAPTFAANSTALQKTLLFCYVLLVRQGL